MQTAWSKKKDECIDTIDNGGQCDYDKPEQLALRAAYPLAWLRFTAATTLFDDNAEQSKKLLNQSIDGFTASMLAMPDPNLIRENTSAAPIASASWASSIARNTTTRSPTSRKSWKMAAARSNTRQPARDLHDLRQDGNAEEAAKMMPEGAARNRLRPVHAPVANALSGRTSHQ